MVRERSGGRILSAVAIFLTAIALQRACTLPWARSQAGTAPTAVRHELSVVGLSRLGDATSSTRVDCRWWPRYGDPTLCGPRSSGAAAYRRLRLVYPFMQAALWLSVASLLLQALRVPRHRAAQAALPTAAFTLTVVAILFVRRGASEGLDALASVHLSFSATGYFLAFGAAVLSGLSAIILLATVPVKSEG